MARLERITPAGVPVHIIQRGHNRQVCFVSEEDFAAHLRWLKIYSQKYGVFVHARVLMTNHVHLLCTPKSEGTAGRMMQAVGRQYVLYFNNRYQRYRCARGGPVEIMPRANGSVLARVVPVYRIKPGTSKCTNKGLAIGDERFKLEIDTLTGRGSGPERGAFA